MKADRDCNVVPLRPLPRLNPDDVIVLSLYRNRRAALGPRSRDTLGFIEALLYQDGIRRAQQALDAFPADVRFDTDMGTIYHAWCPVRERHTLCDFELLRGGGGQRCERDSVIARLAAGICGEVRRSKHYVGRVASALISMLHLTMIAIGTGRAHRWSDVALRSRRMAEFCRAFHKVQELIHCKAKLQTGTRYRRAALVESCPLPAGRAPPPLLLGTLSAGVDAETDRWRVAASHAADWSLLGSLATVSAELDSPFSRSILCGEYLCQVGYAVDRSPQPLLRNLLFARRWFARRELARRRRLYEESSLLVSTLNRRARINDRACMFLTGDFPLRDLAADERLLALVRCELVMRISSRVYLNTLDLDRIAVAHRDPEANRRARASAFRQFALVTELSGLAAQCFAGPAIADVANAVIADYAESRRRRRHHLRTVVLSIADYDRWLSTAQAACAKEVAAADRVDPGERIRVVISELLGLREASSRPPSVDGSIGRDNQRTR